MNTSFKLCAAALSALLALPAAAAQRTFVASFGNDANPCSVTAPCRTFTRAMTQTTADGEVIVLDSAGYGAFTITQSVSIIAPDGVYAGISVFAGEHGIVVNGAGIKVTLRGLTLNGQGGDDGIRIENAGNVFIERVTVANTGNDVFDAGIRVAPGAAGARVSISDSAVRGNGGRGIRIEANATVQVDGTRIEGNAVNGIRGDAPGGRLRVSDSVVSGNASSGIDVNASALGIWGVTVVGSIVDGNGVNGILVGNGVSGTYRVAVTDSFVARNGNAGVAILAVANETATAVVGDNRIVGNSLSGIRCTGLGTGALVAERNEVVANSRAFEQADNCTLESLGNNTARQNANADFGTIATPSPALR